MIEILFFSVTFGIGAAVVASGRGSNGFAWFLAGSLLGPIGFGLAFTTGRPCAFCRSKINIHASICPKCGKDQPKYQDRGSFGPDFMIKEIEGSPTVKGVAGVIRLKGIDGAARHFKTETDHLEMIVHKYGIKIHV